MSKSKTKISSSPLTICDCLHNLRFRLALKLGLSFFSSASRPPRAPRSASHHRQNFSGGSGRANGGSNSYKRRSRSMESFNFNLATPSAQSTPGHTRTRSTATASQYRQGITDVASISSQTEPTRCDQYSQTDLRDLDGIERERGINEVQLGVRILPPRDQTADEKSDGDMKKPPLGSTSAAASLAR